MPLSGLKFLLSVIPIDVPTPNVPDVPVPNVPVPNPSVPRVPRIPGRDVRVPNVPTPDVRVTCKFARTVKWT